MKKRPFKNILPLAFSILFLIGSCSKEKFSINGTLYFYQRIVFFNLNEGKLEIPNLVAFLTTITYIYSLANITFIIFNLNYIL